ncbi:Uncharacterised protein [Vibrio cholerae]|uniref:Uncharacterized protein n=1 Tax=Vibrio cholerae TaxID=666 RepID=A0A655TA17_VIBCL|nr:Uncharacterised protein [Vibrio cholerae]CSA77015.1 Uncharacterised protein [Vibrio cholerae]CSB32750.1 Uncharacterised protein [Vibrio cholerae]
MMATAIFAVAAVLFFSSSVMWPVRETNTGIMPTGFTAATRPRKNWRNIAISKLCMMKSRNHHWDVKKRA